MASTYSQTAVVTDAMSASSMGSGELPVFATPALVALMESTAMKAIGPLEPGSTTVGTAIDVKHVKASAIGETVSCQATVTEVDGRRYVIDITATNAAGEIIGTARHERFLVNAERFLSKLRSERVKE